MNELIPFLPIFFLMLCGHSVADFALQSEFIATNKNRHFIPKGYDAVIHGPRQTIWPYVLFSHSLIHGTMIYLITGSTLLALAESIVHSWIDFGKCEKWYGIHTDQWLHIASKAAWAWAFVHSGGSLRFTLY